MTNTPKGLEVLARRVPVPRRRASDPFFSLEYGLSQEEGAEPVLCARYAYEGEDAWRRLAPADAGVLAAFRWAEAHPDDEANPLTRWVLGRALAGGLTR